MPRITQTPKPLYAFLTGSRVYGVPTDNSDIDLVVLMDKDTYYKLADQATKKIDFDNPHINHPSASDEQACPSLRFDNLNIIPVFEPELYQAWKKGTKLLEDESPVSKKRACQVLEELRKKAREEITKRKLSSNS